MDAVTLHSHSRRQRMQLTAWQNTRNSFRMKNILVFLTIACCVSMLPAGADADMPAAPTPAPGVAVNVAVDLFDAPPDVGRNRKYYNFIGTDSIHAACYYAFCECGKQAYAGHLSDIHEISCDSHRIGISDKSVFRCSKNQTCKASVSALYDGLFKPLVKDIKRHELKDKSCKFFLSTCYGMLLKDAVHLYGEKSLWGYFDRPVKAEAY